MAKFTTLLDKFHQVGVFGRDGLWPSLSNPCFTHSANWLLEERVYYCLVVAWISHLDCCPVTAIATNLFTTVITQLTRLVHTPHPVNGSHLYQPQSSASTFCQSSSARGAASPSQHVRLSGLRSGWSDVLELTTEQSPWVGVWWQHFRRLFQTFIENISL